MRGLWFIENNEDFMILRRGIQSSLAWAVDVYYLEKLILQQERVLRGLIVDWSIHEKPLFSIRIV